MKTAVQELIEWLKEYRLNTMSLMGIWDYEQGQIDVLSDVIKRATELLEKERELSKTVEERALELIDVVKSDIRVCMRDFDNLDKPTSSYPIGDIGVNTSKSEVYHRGRLKGLEDLLPYIKGATDNSELREAAEKAVKLYNAIGEYPSTDKAIDELEKAVNQNK